jgi:predicted alpha/beta-fold hydrolase
MDSAGPATIDLARSRLGEPAFTPFRPRAPWWGGDLQTLHNFFKPGPPRLDAAAEERLYLPVADGTGDRLAAALAHPAGGPAARLPLVVLIHGLGGSEASFYMIRSAAHLLRQGYPVLRLNLRGAGPSRPYCRFQYHAGRTGDLADALAGLPPWLTRHGIAAVGYSLGGNLLLKYLGETGTRSALRAAVTVSAPLDLAATSRRMSRPRNRIYELYLLHGMKQESLAPGAELSVEERWVIQRAESIRTFDERFTAPRNGFDGADDYYRRTSSEGFLDGIAMPTLLIHALDDPWVPSEPYCRRAWADNPSLRPLLPSRGGHVGFVGRDPVPWHDLAIARFLATLFSPPLGQPALSRRAASTAE